MKTKPNDIRVIQGSICCSFLFAKITLIFMKGCDYMTRTLICKTKREAKDVLRSIKRFIKKNHYVTVADICDVNKENKDFMDYREGWSDIRNAKIIKNTNNGSWLIAFPPVEQLDDMVITIL